MKIILINSNTPTTYTYINEFKKLGVSTAHIYTNSPDESISPETNSSSHLVYLENYDTNKIKKEPYFEFTENNCKSLMTEQQMNENNLFILPPTAAIDCMKKHSEKAFMIVYISNKNEPEADGYAAFEQQISSTGINELPDNCQILRILANNTESEDFTTEIKTIKNTIIYHENLIIIIKDLMLKKIITHDENNNISTMCIMPGEKEPSQNNVSIDLFAAFSMSGAAKEMFQYLMSQYLSSTNLTISEHNEKGNTHE